jgi:hypothetical protein
MHHPPPHATHHPKPTPAPQSPLVTGAKQLWRDTSELLAPIGRLGLPHATLQTKCPHYE